MKEIEWAKNFGKTVSILKIVCFVKFFYDDRFDGKYLIFEKIFVFCF